MKKQILLLLVMVMLVNLVACGGTKELSPQEDVSAQNENGGVEYLDPVRLPLSKTNEVITIGLSQKVLTEDYNTNAYTLWLEEQTGIDLEFFYFSNDKSEAATQLAMMISGGQELPDIIWDLGGITLTQGFEYGKDGFFLPLEDYFAENTWFWDESFFDYSKTEQDSIYAMGTDPTSGHLYAFPEIQKSHGGDNCMYHAYINQAWLDAVGMEVPTNVDEMYEVLKAFVEQDPNKNGLKDEIPSIGFEDGFRAGLLNFLLNAFVYINDAYIFNVEEDGQLWIPYDTEEYRQGLIYLNKLYKEGLISPQSFTIEYDSEMAAVVTPSDGETIAGLVSGHFTLITENQNEAVFDYVVQPPLQDATGSGRGGYGARMDMSYFYHTFITRDAENPDLCFQLLDFMSGRESFHRMRYGVKGVHWDYLPEDTDKVGVFGQKAVIEVYDGTGYTTQGNVTWHNMGSALVNYWSNPGVFLDDGSYKSEKSKLQNSMVTIWNEHAKDTVVFNLAYSVEESLVVDEVATLLTSYIKEMRALFTTGVLDPGNDADWESYLKSLKDQGMYEWLEAAQSAYTRMYE